MEIEGLAPSAILLLTGLTLDALFGDPQVPFHPIRLLGFTLSWFEKVLRRFRLDGYGGGCILFSMLVASWVVIPSFIVQRLGPFLHIVTVYFLFSFRDLIDHVRGVASAALRDDVNAARKAIARLVGRDTNRMDLVECRRAAIESLSENFVDGFLSPLFWYALLGIPGLLLFKVVSTMDSMVGYKTPQYLHFGWCGARLDDIMNYLPARLSWLILAASAVPFSELSARKGWRIALQQHSVLPGPNPGWSEATMAGILQRRLIGPIWKDGILVTKLWLGDPQDPEGGSDRDVRYALRATIVGAVVSTVVALLLI